VAIMCIGSCGWVVGAYIGKDASSIHLHPGKLGVPGRGHSNTAESKNRPYSWVKPKLHQCNNQPSSHGNVTGLRLDIYSYNWVMDTRL